MSLKAKKTRLIQILDKQNIMRYYEYSKYYLS